MLLHIQLIYHRFYKYKTDAIYFSWNKPPLIDTDFTSTKLSFTLGLSIFFSLFNFRNRIHQIDTWDVSYTCHDLTGTTPQNKNVCMSRSDYTNFGGRGGAKSDVESEWFLILYIFICSSYKMNIYRLIILM